MNDILKTRKYRFDLLISLGFTSDISKGLIYNGKGKVVGCLNNKGYVKFSIRHQGTKIDFKSHQFIYYIATGNVVDCLDHINGIKSDNIIINLRSVTNQQNQFNNQFIKGYSWDKKANKWKASITVDGKYIYLGMFENEKDARLAYLEAKEIYHKFYE